MCLSYFCLFAIRHGKKRSVNTFLNPNSTCLQQLKQSNRNVTISGIGETCQLCLDKLTAISNHKENIIQLSEERKLLKYPLQSLFRSQVYIITLMEKSHKNVGKNRMF